MTPLDIVLYILIKVALVFSIIELGLTAYVVYLWTNVLIPVYHFDGLFGETTYEHLSTPAVFAYLLFCSIIGIIVAVGLIVVRYKGRRMNDKSLGWASVTVVTVTMIFWLAGMADLASDIGPWVNYVGGVLAAQLAFAILTWIVFLALTVLIFLTAFGVLRSERRGFHSFAGRPTPINNAGTPMTTSYYKSGEAPAPAPMSAPHHEAPGYQHV